jgi:hypothetical protein
VTSAVAVPSGALTPGRTAVALSLVSVVVHAGLLERDSLGSWAMLGLALACLPCAGRLWSGPRRGTWATVALLDAGMLVLHVQLMAGMHHHGGTALPVGLMVAQLALAAWGLRPARR